MEGLRGWRQDRRVHPISHRAMGSGSRRLPGWADL